MASVAERKFMEELSLLLEKIVTVNTAQGKTYTGLLTGVDADTMSLCLTDVKDETDRIIHKMFINGETILQVYTVEKGFDLRGLAERLERIFPRMVKVLDEAEVIVVMDRIRLTEKGIVEGSGPAAERVQKVYDEFMRDQKKTP